MVFTLVWVVFVVAREGKLSGELNEAQVVIVPGGLLTAQAVKPVPVALCPDQEDDDADPEGEE